MVEAQLFPQVGCGCKNLMPILVYLYNNYSKEDVVTSLKYLTKNNIVGLRLLEVLRSDFNDDFDKLIKFCLNQ
jgi:hypothetical protein